MKTSTSQKKIASKGDRLNWTPLKDLKPVELNKKLIKGKQVSSKDFSKAIPSFATRKVLVP
jgi:hypothetical protein